MTPDQAAVQVEFASDADINIAIERAVADSGVSIDELRESAANGRFESEQARLAWFAISPFFD
jgi:hypothetical protein